MTKRSIASSLEVCNLCSQLAVDSLELGDNLRLFLLRFLALDNSHLPNRVCPECHESCSTAMTIRQKMLKAMCKIEESNVDRKAIVGFNTERDRRRIRSFHQLSKEDCRKQSSVMKGTARKSTARGDNGRRRSKVAIEPKVRLLAELALDKGSLNLSNFKKLTNVAQEKKTCSDLSHLTPEAPRQVHLELDDDPLDNDPLDNDPLDHDPLDNDPLLCDEPASESAPTKPNDQSEANEGREEPNHNLKTQSVSSFGRVRKPKSHDDFVVMSDEYTTESAMEKSTIDENGGHYDEEVSVAKMRKPKPKPASQRKGGGTNNNVETMGVGEQKGMNSDKDNNVNKGDEAAKVASEEPSAETNSTEVTTTPSASSSPLKRSRPPKNFYYMDDEGQIEQSEPKSKKREIDNEAGGKATPTKNSEHPRIDDDDDEELKEVFPSVGPFQCEICQTITDAKRDFVGHIKECHREVIDEDVLNSLEEDLRKADIKEARRVRLLLNSTQQSEVVKEKPSSTTNKVRSKTGGHTCELCNSTLSTRGSLNRHKGSEACKKRQASILSNKNPRENTGIVVSSDDVVLNKRSSFKTKASLAQKYHSEKADEKVDELAKINNDNNPLLNEAVVASNNLMAELNADLNTNSNHLSNVVVKQRNQEMTPVEDEFMVNSSSTNNLLQDAMDFSNLLG